MFSMISLLLALLFMLFFCYISSYRGILLTPQFCMVAGFILSISYGLFWVETWQLNLSTETFLVLLGGIGLFVIESIFMQELNKKRKKRLYQNPITVDNSMRSWNASVSIETWKLYAFLLIQLFTLFWTILFIQQLTNDALSSSIYYLRHANLFGNEDDAIAFPVLLRMLRIVSTASEYFWSYLLLHSIIYKYKTKKILLLINILLSIVNSCMTGARGGAFKMVMGIGVQAYIIWGIKNHWRIRIKIKTVFRAVLLGLAMLFTFQAMGNLLGRGSSTNLWEYIAIYLSAEIKNLDIFIRRGRFGADLSSCQTIIYVINWLSSHLGSGKLVHRLDIPFLSVNGHNLGNVYTIFYMFLYDGGYWGLVGFTTLMALISQYTFSHAVKNISGHGTGKVRISILIYSFMLPCIFFSFFSDWFYESIFNSNFVYMCIVWIFLKIYIEKVSLVQVKHRRSQGEKFFSQT